MIKTLQEVAKFNIECPVGTEVIVSKDDGTQVNAKVKYPAELIGARAVGYFSGITGCYSLSRVKKVCNETR